MNYKMSELVAKTNVPKSTILYYIKEGLLPAPHKVKANVHRYSDEHIELIKYIKYMKEEMRSSNEQIKQILEKKNNSFSSSYTMLAPLMNTLSGTDFHEKHYTKKEFIEHFEIDTKLLETLLEENILIPINNDDYTSKEASIINLVENFLEVGVNYSLLKKYVHHAQELAKLELEMQQQLCAVRTQENFSTLWKIVFDTLFNTKEYIFNRTTYRVLYNAIKNELIGK
jgi:DNA-binding transcriptional MerR regulator